VDKKDKEIVDLKIRNVELRMQEYRIDDLEHRRDFTSRLQELEKWRASATASFTRNAIIIGFFAVMAAIIGVFLTFFLRP
jgi:hypothetical protein